MPRCLALIPLMAACGWGDLRAERVPTVRVDPERAEKRQEAIEARLTMATRKAEVPKRKIADLGPEEPPFVALLVLDTLRADRTSLCGYKHPTTPVLIQARDAGALWSCDAYSPATWTLPAHASYFTGAGTAEHGVHTLGTRLDDRFETLAETYRARGYQTLFISGNPVFTHEATGFWQGFDRVVSAKALTGPARGPYLTEVITHELEKLDRTEPLFLVINIFDAHDPYPPVPEGVPWAKAQERTNLLPHTAKPTNPYYAYVTGLMKAEDKPGFLDIIQNGYQWAVHVADANLGETIRLLRQHGWFKQPHRIVITSDHGEHLGEHELLRHGSATWQNVTRVPFLYLDNTPTRPTALPSPLNTTAAFSLLRDGHLPEPALEISSASATNPEDFKPSWFTVALWNSPTDKIMHFDGKEMAFDLAADPGEEHPLPLPADHPLRPQLRAQLEAQQRSIAEALARPPDAAVMEMLKSVGYVQDGELPDDGPDDPKAPPKPPAN